MKASGATGLNAQIQVAKDRGLSLGLVTGDYYRYRREVLGIGSPRTSEEQSGLNEAASRQAPDAKPPRREVTLESLARDIRELEKRNPSLKLDLELSIRRQKS